MKSITVFCGSSSGSEIEFESTANKLGQTIAAKDITLVYGGAKIGLMGAVAKGALQASGKVIGVLPTFLRKKEVVHSELTELFMVDSMHERKQKMFELSEGFIALPGGFGTLEELFEILTWAQLARHQKPIGILNINGYYDKLLQFLKSTVEKKFVRENNLKLILVSNQIDDLLDQMNNYSPPSLPRWISKEIKID